MSIEEAESEEFIPIYLLPNTSSGDDASALERSNFFAIQNLASGTPLYYYVIRIEDVSYAIRLDHGTIPKELDDAIYTAERGLPIDEAAYINIVYENALENWNMYGRDLFRNQLADEVPLEDVDDPTIDPDFEEGLRYFVEGLFDDSIDSIAGIVDHESGDPELDLAEAQQLDGEGEFSAEVDPKVVVVLRYWYAHPGAMNIDLPTVRSPHGELFKAAVELVKENHFPDRYNLNLFDPRFKIISLTEKYDYPYELDPMSPFEDFEVALDWLMDEVGLHHIGTGLAIRLGRVKEGLEP